MRLWNKAPAIWFPSRLGTVIDTADCRLRNSGQGHCRSDNGRIFEPLQEVEFVGARLSRARGDERLSGSKQRESGAIDRREGSSAGADKPRNARKDVPKDKGVRKQRASDLGRALRSIYDDTLRESVPDDFNDLLGKLS